MSSQEIITQKAAEIDTELLNAAKNNSLTTTWLKECLLNINKSFDWALVALENRVNPTLDDVFVNSQSVSTSNNIAQSPAVGPTITLSSNSFRLLKLILDNDGSVQEKTLHRVIWDNDPKKKISPYWCKCRINADKFKKDPAFAPYKDIEIYLTGKRKLDNLIYSIDKKHLKKLKELLNLAVIRGT